MQPVIVIPARLASTRLPRKALADIGGLPMIVRVVQQARKAQIGPVLVAAGDQAICDVVAASFPDVRTVLTDPTLPSGSDRVQAALEEVDPTGVYDAVINVQGDLPLIEPDTIKKALKPLQDPAWDIGTLVTPIRDEGEKRADSVVKAVCAFAEEPSAERPVARALYFSRQAVPWGEGPFWHHVGLYAWRRASLRHFVSLSPSPLELREKLEQLRALEAGMSIGCCRIETAPLGVDTQADLESVRMMLCR